jgi:excisionase family DNA binding protein
MKTKRQPSPAPGANGNAVHPPDVLTLSEAAAYLRITEEDALRLANGRDLPGRKVGADWRFLKSALDDWLKGDAPASGREALLAMAGMFKEDPFLTDIVREAYRKRQR